MEPADLDIDCGDVVPELAELAGFRFHFTLLAHPALGQGGVRYHMTLRSPNGRLVGSQVVEGGLGPLIAAHTMLAVCVGREAADAFHEVIAQVMIADEFAGL